GIYAGDLYGLGLAATFPQFKELERQYGSVIRGLGEQTRMARERAAQGAGREATASDRAAHSAGPETASSDRAAHSAGPETASSDRAALGVGPETASGAA